MRSARKPLFPGNPTRLTPSKPMQNERATQATGENIAPDAVLVRRAQDGDTDALSTLVTRYQDRIYNACYRMCNHEADAMDLTQTAFLRAFQAIQRFEARSSFFTWVFRIAVNLTMSHRRQRSRRASISLDQPDGEATWIALPDKQAADAALDVERHELCQRLQAALARLDDDFRIAVVLKDIEDMDYATIAEIVDVPVGTVKSRIHRGRTMLRKLLSGEAD